ncbi:MAG: hypothetical protein NT023_07170 [Armatimonadetes bacterium]|nr:hypothetical protein [Armatimonadota bacterium]
MRLAPGYLLWGEIDRGDLYVENGGATGLTGGIEEGWHTSEVSG